MLIGSVKYHEKPPTYLAVLFADDVLLSAKSPEGLQNLLDIASAWAEDYQNGLEHKARKK